MSEMDELRSEVTKLRAIIEEATLARRFDDETCPHGFHRVEACFNCMNSIITGRSR